MNSQVNSDIPDTLLKTGASMPNQHSVVLTIYDSVTSVGMYFKTIRLFRFTFFIFECS